MKFLALMEGLAKDGQTMIVVTHSMGFARNVASQVPHVFADGYGGESGPPSKVYSAPRSTPPRSPFLSQTSKG